MNSVIRAPLSPATALHPSRRISTRAAPVHASCSNADVRSPDLERRGRDLSRAAKSSSVLTSPSQANSPAWIDGTSPPPRMFPGVVHERTRRGSLRQGSHSEKDMITTNLNITTAPRPLPWEQDNKGLQKAIAKEPSEQGPREDTFG